MSCFVISFVEFFYNKDLLFLTEYFFLSWGKTNVRGVSIGWVIGGYIFTKRIDPYLVGNRIRSQGSMTSYANDVITKEIHINTGYGRGVL